jgi:MFS family permease
MSTSSRSPLAGLSLTMLMSSLDTSIANAALPALSRAFGASFQSVRWIVLTYLLTLTVFTVIAGRLGDIAGRRRLLLAGLAVFTVASLACGVAPNLAVLLAARAAQGLGAAGMMSLAVALVGDIVPATRTGRAMGLLGTTSAIGTTLGPSLGGVLTARFGWEAIFLVNVPIGMLALLLVYRGVPADRARARVARVEAGAGISLLRTPAIGASLIATVLVAAVGPFYLSRSLGLDVAEAGVALSIGPFIAVLAGWPAGRLVDRFGARAMTLAGLTGLAAGASMVGVVSVTWGVAGYVAPIAGMTASYALFQAANNTFLMTTAGPRDRGAIAGMLGLGRNLGLIAGAWAMGIVFAWAVDTGDAATASSDVVAAGVRVTFRVSAGLITAAVAIVASARASTRRSASADRSLHHARALTHSQGR